MAAKVVDFPLPVGPVTRISPFSFSAISARMDGMFSCLRVGQSEGMSRKAAPSPRSCRKRFTRNRARPLRLCEKSSSRSLSNRFRCSSLRIPMSIFRSTSLLRGSIFNLRKDPWSLIMGGSPALRWRSDAPCCFVKVKSSVISTLPSKSFLFFFDEDNVLLVDEIDFPLFPQFHKRLRLTQVVLDSGGMRGEQKDEFPSDL